MYFVYAFSWSVIYINKWKWLGELWFLVSDDQNHTFYKMFINCCKSLNGHRLVKITISMILILWRNPIYSRLYLQRKVICIQQIKRHKWASGRFTCQHIPGGNWLTKRHLHSSFWRWGDHNSFNVPAQRKYGFILEVIYFFSISRISAESLRPEPVTEQDFNKDALSWSMKKKSSFHLNTNTGRSKVRLSTEQQPLSRHAMDRLFPVNITEYWKCNTWVSYIPCNVP